METLPIIWRSADPAYEDARVGRVFTLRRPNRYPLAVVNASQEAHVVEAVKLAVEKGCRISVRSGGHSWSVSSVRDNAILVDLGTYHEMTLDEETGIARVSPSTTSAEINEFLLAKGRMFAGGHCPDVALGGFLLLGGVGWNARVRNSETLLHFANYGRAGAGLVNRSTLSTWSRRKDGSYERMRTRTATCTGPLAAVGQAFQALSHVYICRHDQLRR